MDIAQKIKDAGIRATLTRVDVLSVFVQHKGEHLSAEDVYQALLEKSTGNSSSLATVYRVLMQFEEAKILRRHQFSDNKAIYELDDGEHHDHIICVDCGRVEEFYSQRIEKRQVAVAEKCGFTIVDHAMTLYAECTKPDCPHRGG
ncbi:MAG: transcriptional repressor [Magnetococcales bacterium]|nr:transcriptional repressor [Magnetococcales bacterium]